MRTHHQAGDIITEGTGGETGPIDVEVDLIKGDRLYLAQNKEIGISIRLIKQFDPVREHEESLARSKAYARRRRLEYARTAQTVLIVEADGSTRLEKLPSYQYGKQFLCLGAGAHYLRVTPFRYRRLPSTGFVIRKAANYGITPYIRGDGQYNDLKWDPKRFPA